MTILAGMHSLEAVELALACPLLVSPAAFIRIGRAWGDDGGVEFAEAEADGEFVIGAAGHPTYVLSGNRMMTATLTITPTSQAHRLLGMMYKDWMAALRAGGRFIPISFNLVDPSNGDIVTDPSAGFISPAMPSKAKSKTDGQWVFGLPNGKQLLEYGTLNTFGP